MLRFAIASSLLIFAAGCDKQPVARFEVPTRAALDNVDLLYRTDGELISERWYVHRLDGQKVGHRWFRSFAVTRNGRQFTRCQSVDELEVVRFQGLTRQTLRTVVLQDDVGHLLEFESEVKNAAQPRLVRGLIAPGKLLLCRDWPGAKIEQLDWADDDGGYFAIEQSLAAKPLKAGESRTLRVMLPVLDQLTTVRLTARTPVDNLLPVEIRYGDTTDDARPDVLWLASDGGVARVDRAFLDHSTLAATEQQALAPNDPPELATGLNIQVPLTGLSKEIQLDQLRWVQYRATLSSGNPATLFAHTRYQRLSPVDDDTARVKVYREPPDTSSADAKPRRDDLAANRWLQVKDRRVAQFAGAIPRQQNTRELVFAIQQAVFDRIGETSFDNVFATAADVVQSGTGDCTEHAMLMAATCRARGVPARLVVGLKYSPEFAAMIYHMWNEVWIDDRWVPVDATTTNEVLGTQYLRLQNIASFLESDYSLVRPVMSVAGNLTVTVEATGAGE